MGKFPIPFNEKRTLNTRNRLNYKMNKLTKETKKDISTNNIISVISALKKDRKLGRMLK